MRFVRKDVYLIEEVKDLSKTFYVTTPIYYVNSDPHIGSAYTTIVADVVARYKRMMGYDTFFLTGTDEHGQKIMRAAKEKGMDTKKFVDDLAQRFIQLWKDLEISNDLFIRTTDDYHVKTVQEFFQKMYEKGDIYLGKYEGWYCVHDETFWTEKDIGPDKLCPVCHRPLEHVEEENYFFRLSKYTKPLLDHFRSHPDFVEPDFRRNEMIKILEEGLEDISVSRTSFDWGIPLPFDKKHVIYVWFDALINYVSAVGYGRDDEKFKKYWPADVHFVGKEINRFHSLIWPAMLMSVGLPLPKKIFAHGWLTVNGEKISKSKGNAVDPRVLVKAYGLDAVKYYLLRDITFGNDGDFSEDNLIVRINADLANDLGNLVHRTLSMVNQNFEEIPDPSKEEKIDDDLKDLLSRTINDYFSYMDSFKFTEALISIWNLVKFSNKYIDMTEPWLLARDPSKKERLGTVLYNLVDVIRNISIMISPIMVKTSKSLIDRINQDLDVNMLGWHKTEKAKIEVGEPLFPRIDTKVWKKVIKMAETEENQKKAEISIEDFAKIDLRVARIKKAERIPKSEKLVKLILDVGGEERQIVTGIGLVYTPESLIGREIIIIYNLKPTKLMGVESNGMLLAAKDGEKLRILTVDGFVETGAKIS
ncbi:methionine--tRNA ligase [Athalassotoga saccharophila]|uniref:methionine--tRNA ligase n=1 Tax=Athalassotoga saccharophila TaxID=1441386 RepID=UPI00137B29A4|nr:methionine--tRNA ligase [Athalassotoga saccharophila]BBJ27583.1 methionine--tRNA ligase [Athalassotoga saccharophila]